MDTPVLVDTIGLGFDLVGAILIFAHASVRSINEIGRVKQWAKIGIGLLAIGFGIQFVSNLIDLSAV